MATPYKVHVTPENTGHLGIRQTPEAASMVTDLLQRDLDVSFRRPRAHELELTISETSRLLQRARLPRPRKTPSPTFPLTSPHKDQIVHDLLSLYGTGATAEHIQRAYDVNASYQLPAKPPHNDLSGRLADWDAAKEYLGQQQYYPDLFRFFQGEIEKLGWKETMVKYLFEGSERSEDLLRRMFAGAYLIPSYTKLTL